jgi:hypothetical protein
MVCGEAIDFTLASAGSATPAMVRSGLYRRQRREAINYPPDDAMSRENPTQWRAAGEGRQPRIVDLEHSRRLWR